MKTLTLQQYLDQGRTQREAADIIGCSQGAISQMLKSDRQIYFEIGDDGETTYYEKTLPGKRATGRAA